MPMAARGRRRASKRPSKSALALRWIGVAILLIVAVGYVQPLRAYEQAEDDVAARRAQVERMELRNERLEQQLEEAGTTEFIERSARRLGLVKPGERLFVVTGLDRWKRDRGGGSGAPLP
jgi:cell division protein FtsB